MVMTFLVIKLSNTLENVIFSCITHQSADSEIKLMLRVWVIYLFYLCYE